MPGLSSQRHMASDCHIIALSTIPSIKNIAVVTARYMSLGVPPVVHATTTNAIFAAIAEI